MLIAVPAVSFVALEGGSSLVLFVRDLFRYKHAVAERLHTRYDPELGWVSRPNVYIPNMYGPGVYLRTNGRGFRSDREVALRAHGGQRLLCSGDSFTLGYGVDNAHTWCELLRSRGERLETVNMGQGGYGFDQAYLWYKRDGAVLDHDVHVFAYIVHDFDRMRHATFKGYHKPILALRDGILQVDNVPVPPPDPPSRWIIEWVTRYKAAIAALRAAALVRTVLGALPSEPNPARLAADSLTWEIAAKATEDLVGINRSKGSALVLVHLPTVQDTALALSASWRRWVSTASRRQGFLYLDLVADFHRLPADSIEQMFIPQSAIDLPEGDNHYTVQGNRWVAEKIYDFLIQSGVIRPAIRPATSSPRRSASPLRPPDT